MNERAIVHSESCFLDLIPIICQQSQKNSIQGISNATENMIQYLNDNISLQTDEECDISNLRLIKAIKNIVKARYDESICSNGLNYELYNEIFNSSNHFLSIDPIDSIQQSFTRNIKDIIVEDVKYLIQNEYHNLVSQHSDQIDPIILNHINNNNDDDNESNPSHSKEIPKKKTKYSEKDGESSSQTMFYSFNFDDLPDYEPLEVILQQLRQNDPPDLNVILTKLLDMDVSELIEHPQWEELLKLLRKTIILATDPNNIRNIIYIYLKYIKYFDEHSQGLDVSIQYLNCLLLSLAGGASSPSITAYIASMKSSINNSQPRKPIPGIESTISIEYKLSYIASKVSVESNDSNVYEYILSIEFYQAVFYTLSSLMESLRIKKLGQYNSKVIDELIITLFLVLSHAMIEVEIPTVHDSTHFPSDSPSIYRMGSISNPSSPNNKPNESLSNNNTKLSIPESFHTSFHLNAILVEDSVTSPVMENMEGERIRYQTIKISVLDILIYRDPNLCETFENLMVNGHSLSYLSHATETGFLYCLHTAISYLIPYCRNLLATYKSSQDHQSSEQILFQEQVRIQMQTLEQELYWIVRRTTVYIRIYLSLTNGYLHIPYLQNLTLAYLPIVNITRPNDENSMKYMRLEMEYLSEYNKKFWHLTYSTVCKKIDDNNSDQKSNIMSELFDGILSYPFYPMTTEKKMNNAESINIIGLFLSMDIMSILSIATSSDSIAISWLTSLSLFLSYLCKAILLYFQSTLNDTKLLNESISLFLRICNHIIEAYKAIMYTAMIVDDRIIITLENLLVVMLENIYTLFEENTKLTENSLYTIFYDITSIVCTNKTLMEYIGNHLNDGESENESENDSRKGSHSDDMIEDGLSSPFPSPPHDLLSANDRSSVTELDETISRQLQLVWRAYKPMIRSMTLQSTGVVIESCIVPFTRCLSVSIELFLSIDSKLRQYHVMLSHMMSSNRSTSLDSNLTIYHSIQKVGVQTIDFIIDILYHLNSSNLSDIILNSISNQLLMNRILEVFIGLFFETIRFILCNDIYTSNSHSYSCNYRYSELEKLSVWPVDRTKIDRLLSVIKYMALHLPDDIKYHIFSTYFIPVIPENTGFCKLIHVMNTCPHVYDLISSYDGNRGNRNSGDSSNSNGNGNGLGLIENTIDVVYDWIDMIADIGLHSMAFIALVWYWEPLHSLLSQQDGIDHDHIQTIHSIDGLEQISNVLISRFMTEDSIVKQSIDFHNTNTNIYSSTNIDRIDVAIEVDWLNESYQNLAYEGLFPFFVHVLSKYLTKMNHTIG